VAGREAATRKKRSAAPCEERLHSRRKCVSARVSSSSFVSSTSTNIRSWILIRHRDRNGNHYVCTQIWFPHVAVTHLLLRRSRSYACACRYGSRRLCLCCLNGRHVSSHCAGKRPRRCSRSGWFLFPQLALSECVPVRANQKPVALAVQVLRNSWCRKALQHLCERKLRRHLPAALHRINPVLITQFITLIININALLIVSCNTTFAGTGCTSIFTTTTSS